MSTTAPISAFTQLLPTPCYTLATSFRRIAKTVSKSDDPKNFDTFGYFGLVASCWLSVGESNHVQNQQWWQTHRLGNWGHDLRDQPGAGQDFRCLTVFTKEPIRLTTFPPDLTQWKHPYKHADLGDIQCLFDGLAFTIQFADLQAGQMCLTSSAYMCLPVRFVLVFTREISHTCPVSFRGLFRGAAGKYQRHPAIM